MQLGHDFFFSSFFCIVELCARSEFVPALHRFLSTKNVGAKRRASRTRPYVEFDVRLRCHPCTPWFMNRVLHHVMRAGSAAGRFSSPAADSLCFCSAPYVVGVALLGGKRRARRISDLLQTPTVKLKECNCNHLLITKMTCTYRMWSILTDELLGSIPRDYDAFLSSSSRNFMLVISRSEHAIDHGTMRLCRWY